MVAVKGRDSAKSPIWTTAIVTEPVIPFRLSAEISACGSLAANVSVPADPCTVTR